MMKPKQVDTQDQEDLNHRRKGGAFDNVARIFRAVRKIVFGTSTVLQERLGVLSASEVTDPTKFVKSKGLFEIFRQNAPEKSEFNLMYFGRKGTGEFRNVNYLEFTVNARTGEKSQANGQIAFNITKDGVDQPAMIQLFDLATVSALNGAIANIQGCGDGGAQIGYAAADGTVIFAVTVDKNGISFTGLPTVQPSSPGYLWNSGGFVKIT